MTNKMIYDNERLGDAQQEVQETILNTLNETYTKIEEIKNTCNSSDIRWEGKQKEEFVIFLDLTLQVHKDLITCISQFHKDLGVFPSLVTTFTDWCDEWKQLNQIN